MLNTPPPPLLLLYDGSDNWVEKVALKTQTESVPCVFLSSASTPHSASHLRPRRGKQPTPGWRQPAETAASREKHANTTAIAGPGGEPVFTLSQPPSGDTHNPSTRFFPRLKETKVYKETPRNQSALKSRRGRSKPNLSDEELVEVLLVCFWSCFCRLQLRLVTVHLETPPGGLRSPGGTELISRFWCGECKQSYQARARWRGTKMLWGVLHRVARILHQHLQPEVSFTRPE